MVLHLSGLRFTLVHIQRSYYPESLPSFPALTMPGGSNPFIIEAFTLLGVALTIVVLRTYARASSVGIRRFQLDDYVMLVAAVSLQPSTVSLPLLTMHRSSTPSRQPRHSLLELGGKVLPTTA